MNLVLSSRTPIWLCFLYRDEYYNPDTEDKNLAECIVAKNRSGETGMFKLGWKGEYTKFSNVEFALKEE